MLYETEKMSPWVRHEKLRRHDSRLDEGSLRCQTCRVEQIERATYTAFGSLTSRNSRFCAWILTRLPFGNLAPVTRSGSPSRSLEGEELAICQLLTPQQGELMLRGVLEGLHHLRREQKRRLSVWSAPNVT
jgi:hypothetical protein